MDLFTENTDFYPTPIEVINTMMLGEDFIAKTILEPSAGSGNIVKWLKENGAGEVIACENDPTLCKLLQGECELIAEDFLSVKAEDISHVDFIVMNPPFSEGAKHIMHAFRIAPAGCTIIALCNSSNVESRYYTTYKELQETVSLYGCQECLGTVFDNAERKTDVWVSLVKLYKEGEGKEEFADYMFSNEDDTLNANTADGLVTYNVVREIVNRYVSAVKLFDESMEMAKRINEAAEYFDYKEDGSKKHYGYLPIKFETVDVNGKTVHVSHQQYKKQLQRYYWRIIFDKLNMEKYATTKLNEQINRFIQKQVHVPFTMHNIYQVINMVIQTTEQRMSTALLEAFDLICSFSAENSTAGEKWKTNANYMVNKKFIVPDMVDYDARYACLYNFVRLGYGRNTQLIQDVIKGLCYITGVNYDSTTSLNDYIRDRRRAYGTWYEWGFFRIKCFKKGTMHFEFLDENVWMKFNREVAKQRGWVLPKKTK